MKSSTFHCISHELPRMWTPVLTHGFMQIRTLTCGLGPLGFTGTSQSYSISKAKRHRSRRFSQKAERAAKNFLPSHPFLRWMLCHLLQCLVQQHAFNFTPFVPNCYFRTSIVDIAGFRTHWNPWFLLAVFHHDLGFFFFTLHTCQWTRQSAVPSIQLSTVNHRQVKITSRLWCIFSILVFQVWTP